MLIGPLNAFPWVINGLVQSWVSIKRIQTFLSLENLKWLEYYSFKESQNDKIVIELKDSAFSWNKSDKEKSSPLSDVNEDLEPMITNEDSTFLFSNFNLKIKAGQLIGVVGKVGSGKTSLLHILMAEMEKQNGKFRIDASICSNGFAYVGQECWIKAGTIEENILFGHEKDAILYRRVLSACALDQDLETLPRGDQTPIGENGITLSGGQKLRVALSRACYSIDKEIYLLDDPLSAVDAHVANHLYTQCINGLLANKTRILCTHHIKYLKNADLVLVIENGTIVKSGPGQEIIPSLLRKTIDERISFSAESYVSLDKVSDESSDNQIAIVNEEIKDEEFLRNEEIKKQDEEEREQGEIDSKVLKYYCKSVGIFLSLMTLISLGLMQTSRNLTDFWLSYWTQHHSNNNTITYVINDVLAGRQTHILNPAVTYFYTPNAFFHKDDPRTTDDSAFFFIVYGVLCLANSFFTLLRAFFFAYSGISAGKRIHNFLITSLSRVNFCFYQI